MFKRLYQHFLSLNLKIFYHNVEHVTSLLLGINRSWRSLQNCISLRKPINLIFKEVFLKAPLKIQLYNKRNINIKSAIFYVGHFEAVNELIRRIFAKHSTLPAISAVPHKMTQVKLKVKEKSFILSISIYHLARRDTSGSC